MAQVWLMVIVSVAPAILDVGSLTQATEGVGLIGLACFLGIMARIKQASVHQRQAAPAAASETRKPRAATRKSPSDSAF